jgi:glycosyltransferase involved in cell wall biosynthesis
MRILIATVKIPFVSGGAELHAEQLQRALVSAGHEADIVTVPFRWYPPEQILNHMLACRMLDLTEFSGVAVDRVIGLKFPAYYIPHPNKVLWILHQHRQAYELWDHPQAGDMKFHGSGALVRSAIHSADRRVIAQARAVFANSGNVAARLKRFCGVEVPPLYHPPLNADRFHCACASDHLFFPSRISRLKRQGLVIAALAHTRSPVRVRFAGVPENPAELVELKDLAHKQNLTGRIEWLGWITEEQKIEEYARALAVLYPTMDEDYGYVTLEAMLASKPVITCTDSGGPNEFVVAGATGWVVEPSPEALAAAMDEAWEDRTAAAAKGQAGRSSYEQLGISWSSVVKKLLA